jgi:hypothetical protein
MKNRGDLKTWWYWELLKEERRWGKHAMQAEEIRFEIERRRAEWKVWALWITAGGAVIAAIATIANWLNSK